MLWFFVTFTAGVHHILALPSGDSSPTNTETVVVTTRSSSDTGTPKPEEEPGSTGAPESDQSIGSSSSPNREVSENSSDDEKAENSESQIGEKVTDGSEHSSSLASWLQKAQSASSPCVRLSPLTLNMSMYEKLKGKIATELAATNDAVSLYPEHPNRHTWWYKEEEAKPYASALRICLQRTGTLVEVNRINLADVVRLLPTQKTYIAANQPRGVAKRAFLYPSGYPIPRILEGTEDAGIPDKLDSGQCLGLDTSTKRYATISCDEELKFLCQPYRELKLRLLRRNALKAAQKILEQILKPEKRQEWQEALSSVTSAGDCHVANQISANDLLGLDLEVDSDANLGTESWKFLLKEHLRRIREFFRDPQFELRIDLTRDTACVCRLKPTKETIHTSTKEIVKRIPAEDDDELTWVVIVSLVCTVLAVGTAIINSIISCFCHPRWCNRWLRDQDPPSEQKELKSALKSEKSGKKSEQKVEFHTTRKLKHLPEPDPDSDTAASDPTERF